MKKCHLFYHILSSITLLLIIKKVFNLQLAGKFQIISLFTRLCYIITNSGILCYNSESNNINYKHVFINNETITSEEELKIFNYARFFPNYQQDLINLLLINHHIYTVTDEVNLYCYGEINDIAGYKTELIAIIWENEYLYYIIGIIKNSKLLFQMYKLFKNACFRNTKLTTYEYGSSSSEYLI